MSMRPDDCSTSPLPTRDPLSGTLSAAWTWARTVGPATTAGSPSAALASPSCLLASKHPLD